MHFIDLWENSLSNAQTDVNILHNKCFQCCCFFSTADGTSASIDRHAWMVIYKLFFFFCRSSFLFGSHNTRITQQQEKCQEPPIALSHMVTAGGRHARCTTTQSQSKVLAATQRECGTRAKNKQK